MFVKAINSLVRINYLVFVTEMKGVYCTVRPGSLNIIQLAIPEKYQGCFRYCKYPFLQSTKLIFDIYFATSFGPRGPFSG